MMTHRFSVAEEKKIRKLLADSKKKCEYCRRPITAFPCDSSDHGWNSMLMALDDAEEPCISSGCSRPGDHQAPCVTTWARRHPSSTLERTPNTGWCVDLKCACDCHANEPLPIDDIEEI